MGWGVPRRPKVSNKLGLPNPREGSDGDIQVRQTSIGARIFAKIGGQWLSNKLYGNELDDPDVFIPRVWTKYVTLPSNDTGVAVGGYPQFLTPDNIISGTISIRDAIGGNSIILMTPLQDGPTNAYKNNPALTDSAGHTIAANNAYGIYAFLGVTNRKIMVYYTGSSLTEKIALVSIFFK
jgi:hypothetical protein